MVSYGNYIILVEVRDPKISVASQSELGLEGNWLNCSCSSQVKSASRAR